MEAVKVDFDENFLKAIGDFSLFNEAAETEDEVGTVLRMHLTFEGMLEVLLEMYRTEENKQYLEGNLFNEKLKLAVALGLPIAMAKVATQINKIRNNIAHPRKGHKVNPDDVKRLTELVKDLQEMDPQACLEIEKFKLEVSVRPGEVVTYGSGETRHDFFMSAGAAYGIFLKWLVKVNAYNKLRTQVSESS
ncbi:hypothetical protein [Pseudomonas aeruginosa]|uniref:hypothetical protein n=1 Tax=Pseudomonas aeruginosa TaxID=287 RepID=UPI002E244873|nr:hypothetical protein [Pseudomonas aeruginosa]